MTTPYFAFLPTLARPTSEQPLTALPSIPDPPVFNPPTPANPGKFRCRACQKWGDLGDDPGARLAELWPLWASDLLERAGERWDAPQPERPANPGKVSCRHCNAWTDLGDNPADELRRLWDEWVDFEQERQLAAWRDSPAFEAAARIGAVFAAEHRTEAQQKREAEERRDARAVQRVRELVLLGVDPLTAHAQASAEFPGW